MRWEEFYNAYQFITMHTFISLIVWWIKSFGTAPVGSLSFTDIVLTGNAGLKNLLPLFFSLTCLEPQYFSFPLLLSFLPASFSALPYGLRFYIMHGLGIVELLGRWCKTLWVNVLGNQSGTHETSSD